ncbi:heme NO-binding protein [Sulfitobacter sp. SK012]|uniref:heme NO-binding domain-containing protein n=1 Tax=Sulfitobacter sp. SK012 TaxID=1389005 RepID=UPI000E0CBF34|nr:heme NO-binding domain-containing protein [Sulfitobacter sp. SK012]AXI45915.1 heme NO-binding protein [Sulfitobacter sp. SK012]
MHGLINRSIQNYVVDSYGQKLWEDAAAAAGLDSPEIEAMLSYDDAMTPAILDAVSMVLSRPREELMEDIGTYLVSNPKVEALRRLLRFGGVNFEEFLHSLDDLPDRARLAVSDLDLPEIELLDHEEGRYSLVCSSGVDGFGHVLMGTLRAMADDYGALALLEHMGCIAGRENISITLVEAEFAAGRAFELGARAG